MSVRLVAQGAEELFHCFVMSTLYVDLHEARYMKDTAEQ